MSYYTRASYHICFIFVNHTLNFLPQHPSGKAQDGDFCGDQTSTNKNTLNGWGCRSPLECMALDDPVEIVHFVFLFISYLLW